MSISKDRAKKIQTLLSAAGYYKGNIDGVLGSKSTTAIDTVIKRRRSDCVSDPAKWSADRRAVGAAQIILKYADRKPGSIDGYWGNQTEGAWLEWSTKYNTGKELELDTKPTGTQPKVAFPFPKQSQAAKFFGGSPDTKAVSSQIVDVTLPLPMRIDYSLSQYRKVLRVHTKVSASAKGAMEAVVRHYGEAEWRKLGLDRFAGDYVVRTVRAGASWSQHAYGGAIDFYAAPNGLNTYCPAALFCKSEYKPFFDIWETYGWTSLGRAIGRDWMHVQALGV